MTAGRIAAVENAYRDHSTVEGFETNAREFAAERPDLFDKDAHDTPARVWEFIREGAQSVDNERSLNTAHIAAELLKRAGSEPQGESSSGDESWDEGEFGDESFDFGQSSSREQLVNAIADELGDWSDEAPF